MPGHNPTDGGFTHGSQTLPANTTTWTHMGLSVGQTIEYWVRSCNASGCSWWSNGIRVTTQATTAPAAPDNVRVAAVTPTSVQLAWTDVATDETRYDVYWNVSGGAAGMQSLPANVTGWTHPGLAPGTTVSYWVEACNAIGCSPPGAGLSATTGSVPAPPADLHLTALSASTATLAWTDRSPDETGVRVGFTPPRC